MVHAIDTSRFDPSLWVWGTQAGAARILHTMIRVTDLDAALRFYLDGIGMKQLGARFDVPVRRVTGAFIGFGSYDDGGCLELVHQWDADAPHTHGSGYGHIAIGVPDMDAMVGRLDAMGAECTLRPTALIEGGPKVAFFKDPEGYSIEFIQTRRD